MSSIVIQNLKANDPLFDVGVDYLNTWKGSYRGVQVLQKGSRLAAEIGNIAQVNCPTLKAFDKNLGIGLGAFGFTALPSAASSAIQSISALRSDEKTPLSRRFGKAVKDCADAISSYCLSFTFIRANPLAKKIASLADFIADSTDLKMSCSDYAESARLETKAQGPLKEALANSKKSNFYRLLKNIASVAGAILGLSLFVTAVPAIVLIVISLSSTLLGIKKDFVDATGQYKVIKFDRPLEI